MNDFPSHSMCPFKLGVFCTELYNSKPCLKEKCGIYKNYPFPKTFSDFRNLLLTEVEYGKEK